MLCNYTCPMRGLYKAYMLSFIVALKGVRKEPLYPRTLGWPKMRAPLSCLVELRWSSADPWWKSQVPRDMVHTQKGALG